MTIAISSSEPMMLSLRETRMMVDRILLQSRIVSGSQQAVRNVILGAEAVGLPALQRLDDAFESIVISINPANLSLVQSSEDGAFLSLDAGGEHAWGIGVAVLELGVDAARNLGSAVVSVRNVREPAMLAGLVALAWGYEVDLQVTTGTDMAVARNVAGNVVVEPEWRHAEADCGYAVLSLCNRRRLDAAGRPDSAQDPVMRRILAEGFPSNRGLWERLYTRALGALTPDTVSSRRHAGTVMVDASGKVIGRPDDDDTDFSLLSQPQPQATNTPAAAS
ncbi:MAG: hypothetical protein KG075_16245 [Alphaproteobacteria bacterium]|nr:hypothetical protein [Alphaproteobacteria bacterium]